MGGIQSVEMNQRDVRLPVREPRIGRGHRDVFGDAGLYVGGPEGGLVLALDALFVQRDSQLGNLARTSAGGFSPVYLKARPFLTFRSPPTQRAMLPVALLAVRPQVRPHLHQQLA